MVPGILCAQPQSATEIIRRSENIMRGTTQTGSYSLIIERPDWQRTIVFESWSVGQDRVFILVREPAKERGVAFLKIDREMWQYIPRINRIIKIPPSMMMQSWMGSGFTNDDLVRESSLAEDYHHTLSGSDVLDGDNAFQIMLTPEPETPVAWNRMLYWVRQSDYMPLRAEYYNERGDRVRAITYSDIRDVDGRTMPTRIELVEDRWPDRKTIMQVQVLILDRPVDPSIFTQSNLRRSR